MFQENLIDADSIIFKAGCSNETRQYKVEQEGQTDEFFKYKKDALIWARGEAGSLELQITAGDVSISLGNVKKILNGIKEAVPSKKHRVFIGGKGNFRHGLYKDYKKSREGLHHPIHEKEIRQYLIYMYHAEIVDGEEADDRVSIIQSQAKPLTTCISHIDKDLLNTPGWHYNYNTKETTCLTAEDSELNFWRQVLTGDRDDDIPGLYGYGPVTAKEMLPTWADNLGDTVWEAYQREGQTLEYMILQGQLLHMRTTNDEMWLPRQYTRWSASR